MRTWTGWLVNHCTGNRYDISARWLFMHPLPSHKHWKVTRHIRPRKNSQFMWLGVLLNNWAPMLCTKDEESNFYKTMERYELANVVDLIFHLNIVQPTSFITTYNCTTVWQRIQGIVLPWHYVGCIHRKGWICTNMQLYGNAPYVSEAVPTLN